jgi:prepilin-type N-terminal cleavage/methylation domain-containing protein
MYLKNKKLEAFTLAEMLIVLVITGILVTMALLVLNLIQKQAKSVTTIYSNTTEIHLLERALWQDITKSNVEFQQQQLLCVSEIDTVSYVFKKDMVIRNTDTLWVSVKGIQTYLDGNTTTNNSVVDAIELELQQHQINRSIFIYKTKDAAHYMNYEL